MVVTVMFAVMFKVALTVDCGDDATRDDGDADRKHKTCDDVLVHLGPGRIEDAQSEDGDRDQTGPDDSAELGRVQEDPAGGERHDGDAEGAGDGDLEGCHDAIAQGLVGLGVAGGAIGPGVHGPLDRNEGADHQAENEDGRAEHETEHHRSATEGTDDGPEAARDGRGRRNGLDAHVVGLGGRVGVAEGDDDARKAGRRKGATDED